MPHTPLGIAFRDTGLALHDLCALSRAADDAGYESIWFPEVGSRDAIVVASVAGVATRNALVGTGVVPLYSRNAVSLALASATASEASRGRFVLGIGAGHRFTAEAWYGGTWHHPRRKLRETIEVVRTILAGERVTHNGEVHIEAFHLSSPPRRVPIYIGALSPTTLRLAGEIADGVILNWISPEGVERSSLIAREAAADAGRSVKVLAYVRVAVVEDTEQVDAARQALREQTYLYSSLPAYANSLRALGLGDALDRMGAGDEAAVDKLVDAVCLWGDAASVRSGLSRFREAGLDTVVAYPVAFGDDPTGATLRAIRALAEP